MLASIRRADSSNMEKPLPPAPHMRTASESPVLFMNNAPDSPSLERRPTLPSSTSFQRPKKKLIWRGKVCTVALPLNDGRDANGEPRKYLRPDEVSTIYKEWESKGYDTAGFNLGSADAEDQSGGGRSRDGFPQPDDLGAGVTSKDYRVRIPNKLAWDHYVQELQEAKLRALGVLGPGEEPLPSTSPAPSTMSRQASQTSISQSIPGAPLSANSFRSPLENRFSPPVNGIGNGFGRQQSLQSPVNPSGVPSLHFSRQSMALPMNQFLGHDQVFPPSVSPLMGGGMQPPFPGSGPISRVISPLVESRSQSRLATHSPVSPMIESARDFQGQSQLLPHLRAQDASVSAAGLGQHQLRSQLGSEFDSASYFSHPEIASPRPQGHRHNLSESLQREIDEAESHLEDTIGKQLAQEEAAKAQAAKPAPIKEEPALELSKAAEATTPETEDAETQAKQINAPAEQAMKPERPESLAKDQAQPDESNDTKLTSDLETKYSITASPDLIDLSANPDSSVNGSLTHGSKPSHTKTTSKSSGFAFDPTKNFTPSFTAGMFTFGSPDLPRAADDPTVGLHSKTASSNSVFSSSFNAAAPSFTPSLAPPSREFSFTSAVPNLKPDAPAFKPSATFGISSGTVSDDSTSNASRAFQNFDYSEIVKPSKQSKAIPIIKPETPTEANDDDVVREDEDGRPTTDRESKRARRGGDSGDQVPLFADPSEPPLAHQSVHKRTPSMDLTERLSSPQEATGQLKDFFEKRPASPASSAYDSQSVRDVDAPHPGTGTSGGGPIPRSIPQEPAEPAIPAAELVTSDQPVTSSDRPAAASEEPAAVSKELDAASEEPAAASKETEPVISTPIRVLPSNSTPEKKSALSAAAKPFRFNPKAGDFSPEPAPAPAPKREVTAAPAPKKPIFSTGMGASRYAPAETPPQDEPSQESAQEAEEDSIEARIRKGVSYVEPSYQEIDEVMQTLNGEDSDIGVERHPENAWKHSKSLEGHSTSRESLERSPSRSVSPSTPPSQRSKPQVNTTGSPNQLQQPFQYLPDRELGSSQNAVAEFVQHNPRLSPSYKQPKTSNTTFESPVHHLAGENREIISDWDSALSSAEEYKLNTRSSFFDGRVNDIVGGIIDDRLQPLESRIGEMATALTRMAGRSRSRRIGRSTSADVEDSDADDEDDGNAPSRALSPLKDRRLERFKTSVLEAISAQKAPPASVDVESLRDVLSELKTSMAERPEPEAPAASHEVKQLQASIEELKLSMAQREQPDATSVDEMQKLREGFEEMRVLLAESQVREIPAAAEGNNQTQLLDTIAALKASIEDQRAEQSKENSKDVLREVIEESISTHMMAKPTTGSEGEEAAVIEQLQIQISGLEKMLKVAEGRADKEYRARRAADDATAEMERGLKVSLADVSRHHTTANDAEESLKAFLDDHQQTKQHTAMLEEVKTALEKNVSDLMEKVSALEDTLEEYRKSHTQDKKELEETRAHMKNLDEENQNLDRTMASLKNELQDGIRTKQSLKHKIEKLQEEMTTTVKAINQAQAASRHKEEEHKARYDVQSARLQAEARSRERLELENERLERQEKDAMKAKFLVEQIRGENQHLVGLINNMRTKNHELHEQSNKLQRENHDLKDSNRLEINRIMKAAKADVTAANQQVDILRTNLESSMEKLESEITHQKAENKTMKQRYGVMLEEASASKDTALREAAEAREAALQEHYRFHERTMEESRQSHQHTIDEIHASHRKILDESEAAHKHSVGKTTEDHQRAIEATAAEHERSMNLATGELSRAMAESERAAQITIKEHAAIFAEHEKALKAAADERKASEGHLNGRIHLADETTAHLRDRMVHLEEKLEIAKSAAQAAAEAARAARGSTPQPQAQSRSQSQSKQASIPQAKDSELPEKISPQALRESIMVLQEQLHQREKKIESLEEELSGIDKDAPTKVKEREDEITWLRELFGVRLDDLQELIQTLSSTSYDRDAVRDVAIRLKANLQMEQQERERAMSGSGQSFPSLASITASPRSLPLAAAAAWGSWRKGQSSLGSLAEMAAPMTGTASAQQTPSRASPQSFFSGLLTPPSTNLRQSPNAPNTPGGRRAASSSARRAQRGAFATPPKRQLSASSPALSRPAGLDEQPQPQAQQVQQQPPPQTPPQVSLQADDYDNDAQSEHYSLDQYVGEAGEDEDVLDEPSAISTPDDSLTEESSAANRAEISVELQAD